MTITVEKMFEDIKNEILDLNKVESVSEVLPFSSNEDCNSSFTIYCSKKSVVINCISIDKAEEIKKLILSYIANK